MPQGDWEQKPLPPCPSQKPVLNASQLHSPTAAYFPRPPRLRKCGFRLPFLFWPPSRDGLIRRKKLSK